MKKLLYLITLIPVFSKAGLIWSQLSEVSFVKSKYINEKRPVPLYKNIQIKYETGIQWTVGVSWQEIKEKAKRENKYIFLDCFATWCGPCKRMDQEVYLNEKVGNFFNDKFISVKVQMDKTKNDNGFIQSWYKDAAEIETHYLLQGYPSLLFFSPQGLIVHKETGYKNVNDLITLAQVAIQPGKSLNDDYAEYKELINDYKQGKVPFDRLPFMVAIAKKLNDTSMSRELLKVHAQYVATLTPEKRYSKENVEFWSSLNIGTKSSILQYFLKDGGKIDRVMNKKGYSRKQVNKCIQNFVVTPFLLSQYKSPDALSGLTKINTATGQPVAGQTCYDEADWSKLSDQIRKDFNACYVKSNVLQAKAIWYEKNYNWIPFARVSLKKIKKDPPNFDDKMDCQAVNNIGWNVFLYLNDKKLIYESLEWMRRLVQKKPAWGDGLDTYANLLYKVGRVEEAIEWQEKAVNADPGRKSRQKALEQMKNGGPTYGISRL